MSLSQLASLDARRICIIKPSALGDIVQSLPLLSPLRTRFPEAEISWVVNRGLSGILADHPDLHQVIPFDRHGGLSSWGKLLRQLHAARFDVVMDLQGLLRTGVMCAATRAPIRIGLETAREGAGVACNVKIPGTGRLMPAHARYWRVAEAFGVGDASRQLQLSFSDADVSAAARLLDGLPRPLIAIHPGARWVTKRWPTEKFAEVACAAISENAAGIVVLGSGDEASLAADVESRIVAATGTANNVRNLAGQTSLKELAAVLQSVDMVVSNDSGPMHLAAELGTPVVGIFTCTDPVRSGPPGSQHQLVSTCVSCAGSYQKICPHRGAEQMACLRELSSQRVMDAVRIVMSRNDLPARLA
ncbi:lipopolysaccharide heptosyltransferase II [Symmachiella dynata]|uniref:lipopolysaccharide heptosyltransferase II n=1 Tax=Symmachiella dynata TaxID=2527995 RepID=UPI0030EC53A0